MALVHEVKGLAIYHHHSLPQPFEETEVEVRKSVDVPVRDESLASNNHRDHGVLVVASIG